MGAIMKPSHTITPRSMEECCFSHNADPIEYGQRGMDSQDKAVILTCIFAVIALVLIVRTYG
jgi:hypothetical protein